MWYALLMLSFCVERMVIPNPFIALFNIHFRNIVCGGDFYDFIHAWSSSDSFGRISIWIKFEFSIFLCFFTGIQWCSFRWFKASNLKPSRGVFFSSALPLHSIYAIVWNYKPFLIYDDEICVFFSLLFEFWRRYGRLCVKSFSEFHIHIQYLFDDFFAFCGFAPHRNPKLRKVNLLFGKSTIGSMVGYLECSRRNLTVIFDPQTSSAFISS